MYDLPIYNLLGYVEAEASNCMNFQHHKFIN